MTTTTLDPRKLPRQARSRALVDAILDGAAQIMARQGREALTTNAVAVKAGVSIGSLYQYFPNRESVIAAVAERHGQAVYRRIADVDLTGENTLEGVIVRVIDGLFAAHRIDPPLHAALEGDIARMRNGNGNGEGRPLGAKNAFMAQLGNLHASAAAEIPHRDVALAALTAAELAHAMAHAAIIDRDERISADMCEREAVRAVLAYLRCAA